jgi:hypothetical protein
MVERHENQFHQVEIGVVVPALICAPIWEHNDLMAKRGGAGCGSSVGAGSAKQVGVTQ